MYLQTPVMIPKVKGIAFRRKGTSTYVQYETERKYDAERKYNTVKRVEIGIRIPGKKDMMLPNEKYLTVFLPKTEQAGAEQTEMLEAYEEEQQRQYMLRDLFLALFYEFQSMSRKNPGGIVNADKVRRLNRVLEPLAEMMKGEMSAEYLETIPEPQEETGKDGTVKIVSGKTYSDVALLMTQFKSAVSLYFQKSFW